MVTRFKKIINVGNRNILQIYYKRLLSKYGSLRLLLGEVDKFVTTKKRQWR